MYGESNSNTGDNNIVPVETTVPIEELYSCGEKNPEGPSAEKTVEIFMPLDVLPKWRCS